MVKPGYKQTEIGVIPEDWDSINLYEIGTFSKGKGIKKTDVVENGLPCIRYGELYTHYDDVIRKFYSHIPYEIALGSKKLKKGDILFAGSGETAEEIGKCAAYVGDEEAYAGGDIVIFTPIDQDEMYLGYLLNSHVTMKQKERLGQGDAVVHISSSSLGQLIVPIPPLPEQKAIASTLNDVDALIGSLERLIAKKRDIKRATMQELLTGRRRLPGFEGDWTIKKLGEIARIKTGSRNNQDKTEDGEYPFFVRSATVERIGSYSYDCEAILIPGEGGIGTIYHYINGRFDVHQRVYAITDFSDYVSTRFVYYYLMNFFGRHAMQNTVKATVDSLRLPTFQNFELSLPKTIEEQEAIANMLSNMDTGLAALDNKLAKARLIKQGMMQELLTGRIRLI